MILVNSTPLYTLNICEVCGSYQCPYCPYYSQTAPFSASKFITVVLLITLQILKTFRQFTWQWNQEMTFQLWQKLKKYICRTTRQQSTLCAQLFCGLLLISILQLNWQFLNITNNVTTFFWKSSHYTWRRNSTSVLTELLLRMKRP